MIIRVLFVFAFCFASALAQEIEVKGAVTNPLKVTPEVLAKMPRAAVSATIHGVTNRFEGVWLHDVLKQAGVPSGKNLKGKALTSCLLVKASDGYEVVFSLAELDPVFLDNQVLLADTIDGKPLGGTHGRFRIIIPKETMPSRSVRMVTSLEVVQSSK